jgi:hypothetical protein
LFPLDPGKKIWSHQRGPSTEQVHWQGCRDIEALQRQRKREVNLERAEKAIGGYAATYGAWLKDELGPDDDVSIVFQRLYGKILDHWEKQGVDFQTLRQKKQFLYHLP